MNDCAEVKLNDPAHNDVRSDIRLTSRLMFRLLPMQVILALVGTLNSIISGLFASNFVGTKAMTAVGLYNPINMFVQAVSFLFVGGVTIICGKYMGRSEQDKVQDVFALGNMLVLLAGILFSGFCLVVGLFDLSGIFTSDPAVRPLFNAYIIGQAIGIIPLLLGNQLASFLSLQNKAKRTTMAGIIYIAVNIALNLLFVVILHMEAFGLALASSCGLWVYFAVQAVLFMRPSSPVRLFSKNSSWKESIQIIKIGLPGAASYGYQTARCFIVNYLLLAYVGSEGISAFTAADNLLRIGWALPTGMLAVSRMLISVSIGEEDRQTLTDVMRNMFRRFLPLMGAICALVIVCAIPLTRFYYRDPSDPVYMMTVWGFRILPICMPLSIICMHFTCYAQSSGKQVLVNLLAILDGVVCVAGFTALLIPFAGMNSVYIANVLNGVVTTIVIVAYSVILNKKIPRNMDELMVIPDSFGVSESERMDVSVKREDEVVSIAATVQDFCSIRGIDKRRSYLAGLFLEEMAGNIVSHGFTKDKKDHTVDIRIVHKGDDVIMRIKDDCVPFDPATRKQLSDPDDITKNIGIRMIYKLASDIEYKNMLGLNVLTARI